MIHGQAGSPMPLQGMHVALDATHSVPLSVQVAFAQQGPNMAPQVLQLPAWQIVVALPVSGASHARVLALLVDGAPQRGRHGRPKGRVLVGQDAAVRVDDNAEVAHAARRGRQQRSKACELPAHLVARSRAVHVSDEARHGLDVCLIPVAAPEVARAPERERALVGLGRVRGIWRASRRRIRRELVDELGEGPELPLEDACVIVGQEQRIRTSIVELCRASNLASPTRARASDQSRSALKSGPWVRS